jgi:hypothetical protein
MDESNIETYSAQSAYELGNLVGRHEALGLIASRCSAADAATLLRIREKELWRGEARTWNEFCETRLKMSRCQVNRLIRLLEEFGDNYFTVAQATRISPATYRAIAPAIHDNALHLGGEAIALTEENAPRIAAAIDEFRRTAAGKAIDEVSEPAAETPPVEEGGDDPLDILSRRCSDLMAEIGDVSRAAGGRIGGRAILRSILAVMQARLARLEAEILAAPDGGGALSA